MRLAVFSDVHGNPYALQAVLKSISSEGELDAVIAAGDHCLGGSAPAACIDMLQEAGVLAVYGNTEEYLLAPERIPPDELHRSQWDTILPVVYWTNDQLDNSRKSWLAGLPFSLRFSPNANPASDLVVVHANPRNCELMLLPAEADQRTLWGEIRQPDDDPALNEAMLDFMGGTLVYGHFHTPGLRVWKDINLIDVASVSLPSIDHDRRARYTLISWNGVAWDVFQRAVSYNVKSEQSALQGCGMPNWTRFSNTFD
jgi:predicted phosphodiesterase